MIDLYNDEQPPILSKQPTLEERIKALEWYQERIFLMFDKILEQHVRVIDVVEEVTGTVMNKSIKRWH